MKTKAPEKIYLYPSDRANEAYEDEWGDKPKGEGSIEYIRTDALIEKALEYLEPILTEYAGFYIGGEILQCFKTYMKEE